MKRNHENCIRGYHRSSKAWYSHVVENIDVTFGMYDEDEGGTTGEMIMEWKELDGKLTAQLKCFEDSWSALSLFPDLIQKLGEADSDEIQEEDFVKILDGCGFKDLTSYKSPYENIPEEEMIDIKIPKEKAKKLGLI